MNAPLYLSSIIKLVILLFLGDSMLNDIVSKGVIGAHDEVNYSTRVTFLAEGIRSSGVVAALADSYFYTRSRHFLYYFIISPFWLYTDTPLIYLAMFKIILFLWAGLIFVRWSERKYGVGRFAAYYLAFFGVLGAFNFSLMRDDVLFFLLVVGLSLCEAPKAKEWALFFVVLLVTLVMRSNLAFAMLAYAFIGVSLKKNSILLMLGFMGVLTIIMYPLISSVLGKHMSIGSLSGYPIVFFKSYLSPLPWQINLSFPYVVIISLTISFLVHLIVFIRVMNGVSMKVIIAQKLMPIIFLSVIYFLPYVLTGSFGFRQAALLAPVFSIMLVGMLHAQKNEKIIQPSS